MNNYKLTIQYDGKNYRGWQKLSDSDKTIQSKLEKVLSTLVDEEVNVIGSGRTDAGVHARKQIANFHTEKDLKWKDVLKHCYTYLPEDIVVKSCDKVDEKFHARYNAKKKIYTYRICNSAFGDAFERKYSYLVDKKLNIDKMLAASKYFIGIHDFKSFTSMKSKKKSTVREIYDISINCIGDMVEITYIGEGFLHNMIRILTGTLIEVGLGKMKIDEIPTIMDGLERSDAGFTAPAHGLFLVDVIY
ncbi:tRNA pseudouridine(38-40) synthase TruA [Clostridium cellulovorans]|uniref:tRNA pseudouridine synthase A n=1 Tax=Clostridium cellulovorans (strain ATCC 35296 / DSM 3052 / OCM 3 / 743B) TaxID=573061 RepID=D9SRS8_CLOC7|nr:tRNA pseudouridine(38-40) synthase TruA [Clostridium cellulovorans]ADL50445.1 tRNA pseudouridine synthase A [Clostridium cellulovorans 743B]